MEIRSLEVPGAVPIVVAEAGIGGRPLVLVHGFTGAKEDFTEWLDPLADLGWHAIAFDLRGHGASGKPADEAAYSLSTFAADLLSVLDALGWSSAVALGHSMGGMVLQTAALAAPARFDAIVLMDTSHQAVAADPAVIELAVAIARTEGMSALLAAQEALDGDGPLANEIDRRLKAERPGYKEFGDRKMLASSPAMYAAMIAAITDRSGDHDRLEQLRSLMMPAMVLVGEHDRPFIGPSKRMADALPFGELVIIPDAAHSPQFENPDPWWDALRAFLARVQVHL